MEISGLLYKKLSQNELISRDSPEDFLVWFVGVLVIGHNARLEVLIPIPIWDIPDMTTVYEFPLAQFISTSLVGLPLRPGHHQEAEAAAQREPQDERQSRPENSQERRQAHGGAEALQASGCQVWIGLLEQFKSQQVSSTVDQSRGL